MNGSPSPSPLKICGDNRAAVVRARLLSVLASAAVLLAGCNAPQPSPQPNDIARHEGYDRRERSRDYPSGGNSADATNGGYSRADSYNDERRHRHREHDRYNQDGASENQGYSRSGNHRAASSTPGQFDFYLLNLSWAPEYCYSHAGAPECAAHSAFVLHGLWPQNSDGTYPENCSDTPGPAGPGNYAGLYPDPGLLQHEWHTHGTCTGLSPAAYLATAQRAVQQVKIPPSLEHLSAATSMAPNQLLDLFQQSNPGLPAASLALSCGHNFLTAVEVCLDKHIHPTACQQVRSCGATTVRIPAP